MNPSEIYHSLALAAQEHLLLQRLFLASLEFAIVAAVVALVIFVCRLKTPRMIALLWLLALAKPLVSLAIGSPFAVLQLATPAAEADARSTASLDQIETISPALPVLAELPPAADFSPDRLASVTDVDNPFLVADARIAATMPNARAVSELPSTVQTNVPANDWQPSSASLVRLLLGGWLAGVVLLGGVACLRRLSLRRLIISSECNSRLSKRVAQLGDQLSIRRIPAARTTDKLESPALVGVFAPTILVPTWMIRQGNLDASSLTWTLRHELMHWRLCDPLANLIRGVSQTLFFFHPAAWFAGRRWRVAMELACDRALVTSRSQAQQYAGGLYDVLAEIHDRRRLTICPGLFATRTQIGRRIEVLLNGPFNAPGRLSGFASIMLVVLSLVSLAVGGQFTAPTTTAGISRSLGGNDGSAEGAADADRVHSEAVLPESPPAHASDNADAYPSVDESYPDSVDSARHTLRFDAAEIVYTGIPSEYALAIARTVSAARSVAIGKFGFDMPEKIIVTITANPNSSVRLFNDGQDRFSLNVHSIDGLRKPATSGIRHVYGLCHEVGHLAMYRPIRDHQWMTSAAKEGWAHYLGSRIVDEVFAREGIGLWPDRYDYRGDGMKHLQEQLSDESPSDIVRGAGAWQEMLSLIGDRGVRPIFEAWNKTEYEPADPAPAFGRVLEEVVGDGSVKTLWTRNKTLLVAQRPGSTFAAQDSKPEKLSGPKVEIAHDDGKPADRKSIAGGGHAVRMQAPGDACYLTSVRIHGARYGMPQPPQEDFRIYLCDEDFRSIADFSFPYAKFKRGRFEWVKLDIKPTLVPRDFIVCVGFNPTATKGVFVNRDAASSGHSLVGLPGKSPDEFSEGDWLIRASVVQQSATRTWKNASGKFSIEAELVEVKDGQVQLKRKDGKTITVPVDKLSKADQEYLASQTSGESEDAPAQVPMSRLAGKPEELATDDGTASGKKSLPQGFAVAFESPDDSHYLTSVRIHGARYGYPRPPAEDFHVSICTEDFELIQDFPIAYSKFQRGESKWVTLPVKPTKVPTKFVICVNFNATGQKGVYVSHDAEGKGLVGRPGKPQGSFTGGDWMIRAKVDALK